MDATYNLNPGPFTPRPPLTKERHHRVKTGGVVAAVLALIIGLAYWWIMSNKAPAVPVVDGAAELRSQEAVAKILREVPEYQASDADIQRISQLLKTQPKTTASAEDEALIRQKLSPTK